MKVQTKALLYGLATFATLFTSLSANAQELNRNKVWSLLKGSATYVEQNQIKQRPGQGSCRIDSSAGDGCLGQDRNIEGEWANDIHPLFLRSAQLSGAGILILDSNMFVTGAITYPFYWVTDQAGKIEQMRNAALGSIEKYKKGPAYSFWPAYTNRRSGDQIVGPINFRVDNFDISDSVMAKFAANVLGLQMPWVKEWMTTLMDGQANPDGFASFLNVPNDADDTSVAVSLQTIQAKKYGQLKSLDLSPLKRITQFRDVKRSKFDKRDTWTPLHTGAYLTWLKDESLPLFGDPSTGVIPMGVNNVDCVVNANVVFALAVNNMTSAPGYQDSLSYLAKTAKTGQWLKGCALYYPQKYTFAYSVTRAYRDGGAQSNEMSKAMSQLMVDILNQQKKSGQWCSQPDGTCDYSTALALVSLLNLGSKRAAFLGILPKYQEALKKGFNFLDRSKKSDPTGLSWQPGLFFSAEDYRLGVWRSKALTNAIVVEATAKYLMKYQDSEVGLLGWNKALQLRSW